MKEEHDKGYELTLIKIIGVGGAGCNMLKQLLYSSPGASEGGERHPFSLQCIAINNDFPSLGLNPCPNKVFLDLGGRGEGQPGLCRQAAERCTDEITKALMGADTVVLALGLGGTCGTESAPFICERAKALGLAVVCIVTMPFSFEGKKRREKAKNGLAELRALANRVIVLENDSLHPMCAENRPMDDCFVRADAALCETLWEYLAEKRRR